LESRSGGGSLESESGRGSLGSESGGGGSLCSESEQRRLWKESREMRGCEEIISILLQETLDSRNLNLVKELRWVSVIPILLFTLICFLIYVNP
jgi:hypothetical protein